MDRKEIRVIMCPHDSEAYSISIVNTLESMQEIVGGYIEPVKLEDGVYIICNEDGKILELPQNKSVPFKADGFVGNCFICGVNDGEFSDIPKNREESILLNCKIHWIWRNSGGKDNA